MSIQRGVMSSSSCCRHARACHVDAECPVAGDGDADVAPADNDIGDVDAAHHGPERLRRRGQRGLRARMRTVLATIPLCGWNPTGAVRACALHLLGSPCAASPTAAMRALCTALARSPLCRKPHLYCARMRTTLLGIPMPQKTLQVPHDRVQEKHPPGSPARRCARRTRTPQCPAR